MAQETIDAIRQAEAAAEATEKNAVKQAEAIVAEAKAQGVQLKADMTSAAREAAARAEEDAKAQGEQMMQAAQAEEVKELEICAAPWPRNRIRQSRLSYRNCCKVSPR